MEEEMPLTARQVAQLPPEKKYLYLSRLSPYEQKQILYDIETIDLYNGPTTTSDATKKIYLACVAHYADLYEKGTISAQAYNDLVVFAGKTFFSTAEEKDDHS